MALPVDTKSLVYIDNLDQGITKEVLYNYFKKFNLKSLKLTKTNRIAIVDFANEAQAKAAMLETNCKPILKKPICMSLQSEKGAALTEFHVTGIEKVDLNKIYKIAAKYGKSCKLSFNISDKYKIQNRGYLSYFGFNN